MLARYVPLMRLFIVVLVVALLVVVALFAHLVIAGNQPDAPRTELERGVLLAEEAVRANPEDPNARIKLSAAYLEEGKTGAAKEQAELAIRLAPEDPTAYYALGVALERDGNTPAAVENLQKAVETEGQIAQFYQDAYVALGRIHQQEGDLEAAVDAMDEALKNGPENAILLFERGQMYEELEWWALALMDYKWAATFVPDMTEAQEAFDRLAAAHPDAVADMEQIEESGTTETAGSAQ